MFSIFTETEAKLLPKSPIKRPGEIFRLVCCSPAKLGNGRNLMDIYSDIDFELYKGHKIVKNIGNKKQNHPYVYSEFSLLAVDSVGYVAKYKCVVHVHHGPNFTSSTDVMIVDGKII